MGRFTIINSSPGQGTDPLTLSKIRSHAMRKVRSDNKQWLRADRQDDGPKSKSTSKISDDDLHSVCQNTKRGAQYPTKSQDRLSCTVTENSVTTYIPPSFIHDQSDFEKLCRFLGLGLTDIPYNTAQSPVSTPSISSDAANTFPIHINESVRRIVEVCKHQCLTPKSCFLAHRYRLWS